MTSSHAIVARTAIALSLLVAGCVASRERDVELPPVGSSASSMIDATGGALRIHDLVVTVPPGAVERATEIEVFVEAPVLPATFDAFSPVVRIEPAGLRLAQPIQLRIPFHGDGRPVSVFGERADGVAIVPLTTRFEEDVAITSVSYLASTFVGASCEGGDCTCEPNGELDLLVVVDDSASMDEEQALLRDQLPALFRALATGDVDHDGTQDVPAFASVRVGVTTTDMGVVTTEIESCRDPRGDDGLILVPAPATTTCSPDGARIFEYDAAVPEALDAFVELASCSVDRGTTGCGMEMPLEAALVALSPNAPTAYTSTTWSPPSYANPGRAGQGDTGNAGFLREGSILAVLFITDENDNSTTEDGIFDRSNPAYSAVDLNLRAYTFSDRLQPVQRFVDGLVDLRRQPEDVIVAAVAGAPTGLVSTNGAVDLDAVLDVPEMHEMIDPERPTSLDGVCSSANGRAFPSRRVVEVLRGVEQAGGRAVLQSICEPSFDQLTIDLATQLGARASGGC